MAQIVKKFITDNAVADEKIRLDNNAYLRSRNAADNADVNIIKVNASDVPEFGVVPQVTSDPSNANDLVRKSYADGLVSSSSSVQKAAARLCSFGTNLDLTGAETIDGVSTSTGDRILVVSQSAGAENGIYVANNSGAWTRATDFDAAGDLSQGNSLMVIEGNSYSNTEWFLSTAGPYTVGTTALQFRQKDEWYRESITLVAGDITNQYVDLDFKADISSLELMVDGGGSQRFTADFTHSISGGVSRITFAGDLATGGAAELVATDVLRFKYIKRSY